MDPLTIGALLAQGTGLALSLFGGNKQAEVSKQEAQVSGQIAGEEQQINQQKYQQMLLETNRAQLENYRNFTRQKSYALAASVNQGSQFGSGLPGAQAGTTQGAVQSSLGISQGQQIGQNIFGITQDISANKIKLAGLEGDKATAQGLSQLGGTLFSVGPTLGKEFTNILKGGSMFA